MWDCPTPMAAKWCAACARAGSRLPSSCSPATILIRTPSLGSNPAPMIMWQSHFASRCCWRGSGRSSASMKPARTRSFRPGSKMLTGANARKVRLTEKETAILRFLYRAGQLPVSRETLLQEVWGYNSGVTTHTLETHIYRLRQKIEKDAANPEILVTEAGGYKLVP